jgi:Domain of unknown function (DUF4276)
MTYLSWAVLYEGDTDAAYLDLLIPRLMEEIVMVRGTRHSTIPVRPVLRLRRAAVDEVAKEACRARGACYLVFVHADTGGRNLEAGLEFRAEAYCEAMPALCDWPPVRCITISPRYETEAWILADSQAVTSALGYNGSPASIGLPSSAADAERLQDPKTVLSRAVDQVRGRRRRVDVKQIYPAIAQCQSFATLRQTHSFAAFEMSLVAALADLGSI